MNDEYLAEEDDFGPSKSEIKKDLQRLQALGVSLLDLPAKVLRDVPISDSLREELALAARLKHGNAQRRQFQRIGKLMRHEDKEAIEAFIEQHHTRGRKIDSQATKNKAVLEALMHSLLTGGKDALTHCIDQYPNADAQRLGQLLRAAQKEQRTADAQVDKPETATPTSTKQRQKLLQALKDLAGS